MNKPFKPQFSIALALATMTLVAVLLAESLNGGWRSASQVLTVALIELSACAACIAILTHNIPSALSRAQDRNCRRVDGSWSRRRQKIEDASLGELRRELGKAFLLVALVTNALLGLLHFEVIPVPLALQPYLRLAFPRKTGRRTCATMKLNLTVGWGHHSKKKPGSGKGCYGTAGRFFWPWRLDGVSLFVYMLRTLILMRSNASILRFSFDRNSIGSAIYMLPLVMMTLQKRKWGDAPSRQSRRCEARFRHVTPIPSLSNAGEYMRCSKHTVPRWRSRKLAITHNPRTTLLDPLAAETPPLRVARIGSRLRQRCQIES